MKGKCKVLCMLLIAMLTFGMTAEGVMLPAYAKTSEARKEKKSKKKSKKSKKSQKNKSAKASKKAKKPKKKKAAEKSADTTAAVYSGTAAPQPAAAPVLAPAPASAAVTAPSAAAAPAEEPAVISAAAETQQPETVQTAAPQTVSEAPQAEQHPLVTEPAAHQDAEPQTAPAPDPVPEQPQECQHAWDWAIIKEPGCTSAGYKIQRCTVCGETKDGTKLIDPLGHNYTNTEEEGTCLTEGRITKVCQRCGVTYRIPTGYGSHKYENGRFQCSDEKCSVCGKTRTVAGMQGHDYSGEERLIQPATCETPGQKNVFCRYGCGSSITVEIPATGHTYGSWQVVKAPTCLEEGQEKAVCSVCENEITRTVSEGSHVLATKVIDEPTCQKEGKEQVYCTVCNQVTETRDIPKSGHKLGRRCVTHKCHTEETPDGCDAEECHSYVDTCVYCGEKLYNEKTGSFIGPLEGHH